MLDAVQSGEYYQDDEFLPESPLLEARIAKTPQSITPPPIVATSDYSSGLNGSNIPRSQDEENLNRRKKDVKVRTRPTQGDWVLIREMDPNRPDAPVPIRGPGFPALRAQIERFDNKLREEKANSIYAEGNASTPVTQVVRRQRPSNRFQPVVGERIQLEEGECTAAEEAERAAKELEAARKATEEQQQSHQERNTRRPEDSFDNILEHSPASLPSTSLSSRPVSNRQPIIIQSSPPINQQSSTALAPPADASVATSHNEGPPHRGLSRNIADQGEEVPHVGSLSQSALKDKTQEINKASTEKISRRQNVPPSSQGPGRTTYDPNAPAPARRRHNIRPEIHLSQSTRDVNRPSHEDVLSMRSDPTPSPYYQSYYSHAGAVIQPATTRPPFTRLNDLTRHKKLHDEPGNNGAGETGPQYHWTQGAPGGYYDPRASTNMNHRSGSGYSSYVPLKPSSPSSDVAVYGEGDTKKEDGMAELVISGNDADLYKAVQERRRQNRRPIVYEQSPAASDSSTADALETIHSPNALEPRQKWGRHSDLMPENILRLPELENGILVIPDLGLTRYKSTQSRSNAPGEGLSATAGSEDDPEGVEIPEAQTPFRHHLKDKGSPEHRDHVVQKARADETMAIEYTNSQRGADVPLEDPIPRALRECSRRQESLASDHTAAATKSSSQPSPKEYTTRTEQQKELKKKSERQSHSPSPVDLEKIMSEMVQKAMDQAEREGRPEENMVLMDMVTKLMNKGPVSSHTGQRRNSKDTLHDDTFGQLPRRMNDLRSDTKRTHAAATYSVSSDEYGTTSDSGIEPDSPVPLSPVSKDLRKIQKTDDSELEVEEKQTKQTTLSAWDGEVLQKSREVQIDAVVGSPGDNESLAVEVEEYPDANLKHRRPVADSNRSTGIIASEKSVTDVQTDDTVDSGYESALSIREYDHIKAWLGARSVNKSEVYSGSGYDGAASGSSSYAASVVSIFSVASLASSASDISRGSGYSAVQIATATKVLLSVFYEDKTLLSLYKNAIGNENIGPERLQRNLRRLFRAYAGLLENEATERLEYLSSRLVLIKSAFLAQSIVEKLQNGQVGARSPRSERNEESSDEEDDSSNTHLVNEDAFEDLAIFREFLVGSGAFRTFRDQLEAFVLPKPIHLTHEELIGKREASNATTMKPVPMKAVSGHRNVLTWQKWCRDAKLSTDGLFHGAYLETTATSLFHLMMDAISLATDDLLVASGRLEPPLSPNMVRLRWQCACGDSLHSDVSELRKGGVEELTSHMQRTSGAKVLASPHSHQSGNQKYVMPNPTQWIQKAFTSIFGGSAKKSAACLPQHNTSCTSTTTANAPPPQRGILHLLACMHRNRLRKDLKQDRIEDITTDRALLCFLRKQYRLHRGRFLHALSLQSVKGISFVKFRLPIGGSVDVRHHDPCCVADTTGPKTCECIPPPPKVEPSPGAEYRCIPGPPATYPPIPPVYLASLFTCPTDVHEKDTWILDQLPKRTCGELKGQIGQPAEGWGIYYDEGLDGDMLAWTILIVFLVASLLFGVLWSKFQYDIQGAFGVSAYMVACCAAVLPVIVTKLGNKG
ncbi:unnamed protein product [Alternaria alternata]